MVGQPFLVKRPAITKTLMAILRKTVIVIITIIKIYLYITNMIFHHHCPFNGLITQECLMHVNIMTPIP
jgi:hypothetical protein